MGIVSISLNDDNMAALDRIQKTYGLSGRSEAVRTAINAATDAMNGWDPTYGCLYYYNPATATSAWIWSRPIMLQIGRHNFCK